MEHNLYVTMAVHWFCNMVKHSLCVVIAAHWICLGWLDCLSYFKMDNNTISAESQLDYILEFNIWKQLVEDSVLIK